MYSLLIPTPSHAACSHLSTPISTPFSRRLRRSWRPKHAMLRKLVVRLSARGRARPPRALHAPRTLTRWGSGAGAMARAVTCARLARKRRRITPGRKMAGKAPPTMACARPATLGASVRGRGSEASADKYVRYTACFWASDGAPANPPLRWALPTLVPTLVYRCGICTIST